MFSVLKLAFLQLKVAHKLLFDESMKHHQLLLIILITLQIKSYSSAFLIKLLHLHSYHWNKTENICFNEQGKPALVLWNTSCEATHFIRTSSLDKSAVLMSVQHWSSFHPPLWSLFLFFFLERRDCLMIYWRDLPICTVNHNVPSTKEEAIEHTILSLSCTLSTRGPHLFHNQSLHAPASCVTPTEISS